MRIRSLHIDGFGVFADADAELPRPLTVILGDNGAGKSTLLAFIRAVLFGFRERPTPESPRYEPLAGGRHGGSLTVETADGHLYRVVRSPGNKVAGAETVVSLSDDATARDLSALLGGATRDVFENVFAFGLGELQTVASLEHKDVQARLYAAGAGTGAFSEPTVRRALEAEAQELFAPRATKAKLESVRLEIAALRAKAHELEHTAEEYVQLCRERDSLEAEINRERGAEAARRADLSAQQLLDRSWADWSLLVEQRRRLEAMQDVRPVPDGAEERLTAARKTVSDRQKLLDESASRRASAQSALDLALGSLGAGSTEDRVANFDPEGKCDEAVRAADENLRRLAEAHARASAVVEQKAQASGQARERRETLARAISAQYPRAPREIEAIERELTAVRQARALSSEIVAATAQREALAARRQAAEHDVTRIESAPEPIAPGGPRIALLAAIGALVIAAVVKDISPIAAGVLFALFLVTAAVAVRWQRRSKAQVNAIRRDEIAQARSELAELDAQLAVADRSLHDLQQRLRSVWTGLGGQDLPAAADIEGADERLSAERDGVREYREMGDRLRRAQDDEREALAALEAARKSESEAATAQETAWQEWVRWLREQSLPENVGPQEALRALHAVREAAGLLAARNSRVTETSAREQELGAARSDLQKLLSEAGDADEAAFIAHVAAWRERQAMERKVQASEQALEAIAGSREARQALESELSATTREKLTAALTARESALQAQLQRLEALNQNLGGVRERIEALAKQDEQEDVARRLADLKERYESIASEWAVRQACLWVLSEARAEYERERQPAVVKRAGEHLARVTGGRYPGVVWRITDRKLEAETPNGEPRGREAWNRGLLEQIYLCLRLGFIEDYCANTEPLPIVMDDVLANCDPDHARRAIERVVAVSETCQVLYLTCHPETFGFFRDVAGDVAGYMELQDRRLVQRG